MQKFDAQEFVQLNGLVLTLSQGPRRVEDTDVFRSLDSAAEFVRSRVPHHGHRWAIHIDQWRD